MYDKWKALPKCAATDPRMTLDTTGLKPFHICDTGGSEAQISLNVAVKTNRF